MINYLKSFLMLCLITMATNVTAQLDWSTDLKKDLYEINWIRQANDGTLLVGGDKALAGVNPETGEVNWLNKDLKALSGGGIELIQDLPYFIANTSNSVKVINASNGKELLNTKDEDVSVMDFELLQEYNAILFQIKKNKRYEVVWYDLESSSPKWSVDIDKAKGGLKGMLKGRSSFINGMPVIADGTLAMIYKKSVIGIDMSNGAQLFNNTYDDKIASIVSSEDGQLYVGVKKKLDLISLKDGKSILPEMLKLQNKLVDIEQGEDVIYVKHESGFNILNPKTNKFKWKKPHKPGRCDQLIVTKKGFISVLKNEGSGKITLLDKSGEKVWNSNISGSVVFVGALNRGVFYVSTDKSNTLDYVKGKKVNDKDVKIKGNPAVAFDEDNNKVVIFSDKKVTTFDMDRGTSKEIAKDIKFKKYNDSEDWASIESRKGGYFINTAQNVAFVSNKGKLKFNEFHKPVSSIGGFATIASAAGGALGVNVVGAMNDFNNLDRMMNGASLDANNEGAEATKITGGLAVQGVGMFTARMAANKESKDFVYIYSSLGFKKQAIQKIDKDTGKIAKTINIENKDAIYHVDEFLQAVVLAGKNGKLESVDTSK